MTAPIGVQRRLVELGRIRLGQKGNRGQPEKLETFRLTSASRAHLEAAAKAYGGTVRPWTNAPDRGYFELLTEADALDILIPPSMASYSQFYELWSGGGCQRRCDGTTELISGESCLCDPDERECAITTRVNVMLPKVPGLGIWRLETKGWNAASSLPSTLDLLAMTGRGFVPAVLRLEQRSSKKGGQTRRFVVPVIDLDGIGISDLLTAGEADMTYPAPHLPERIDRTARVARPELPPSIDLPDEAESFSPERKPEPPEALEPAANEPPGDAVCLWKLGQGSGKPALVCGLPVHGKDTEHSWFAVAMASGGRVIPPAQESGEVAS